MRYYVESYYLDGRQILGNLDGQAVLDCRYPSRTKWVKNLQTAPVERLSLRACAAVFKVVDTSGKVVMVIDRSEDVRSYLDAKGVTQ